MDVPRAAVIGAPSSAGAHHAGQELAPAAIRAHGFVNVLTAAGVAVEDTGDLAGENFTTDRDNPTQRNLPSVARMARRVADAVEQAHRRGQVAVVLGGDCTITAGVVAGLQRCDPAAALLYFDGDADLSTPATSGSGVLDAMVIAHLLGIADTELARIDGRSPILRDDRLVMLGYYETSGGAYDASVLRGRPALRHVPDYELRSDPVGTARQAVAAVTAGGGPVIVHFDVDAVDSGDLPLGNFPHYGIGVTLEAAGDVLRVLCSADRLAAVVLTEVNPTHDPSGEQIQRYVETVAGALGTGLASPRALAANSCQSAE